MNRNVFPRASLEQLANKEVSFTVRVTLKGHTTLASIAAFTDAPQGVEISVETSSGVAPTPSDSGASFGTLDSEAAPAVIGVLVLDGYFEKLVEARVVNITSASMTAGVVTRKGASEGVTASGNLAFVVSCTTLDLDSSIADHSFDIIIRATRKLGG